MTGTLAAFRFFALHDLRLIGRRIASLSRGAGGRRTVVLVAAAMVVFHALAWPLAAEIAEQTQRNPHGADLAVAGALMFVLPWVISQALTNGTRALYSRGDLDLILSSPASPPALFAARALSIAIESVVSVAIFLIPIADMLAFAAGPQWLAIYPLLAICGLFGTAIGLLLTMGLFRLAGPQRTRTLSQVFATLVGASFALGIQAANFAPPSLRALVVGGAARANGSEIGRALLLPVHAASGDLAALTLLAALAVILFAVVCRLLGREFARGLALAADEASPARVRTRRRGFRTGPAPSLRRKEWRLLRRDPWLASQMILQIAYTVPLCFVLWKTLGPERGIAGALAPAIVVIAAQAAGSLAWITLSTEDAPEFLQTAPLMPRSVTRAKLTAVAIPLGIVLGLPLLILAIDDPVAALTTALFAAAAGCSTALLNLWRPAPGRRGDMLRRHSQSKLVGILEHVLALFWAVAVALFAAGSSLFLAPVVLALLLLLANRRSSVRSP